MLPPFVPLSLVVVDESGVSSITPLSSSGSVVPPSVAEPGSHVPAVDEVDVQTWPDGQPLPDAPRHPSTQIFALQMKPLVALPQFASVVHEVATHFPLTQLFERHSGFDVQVPPVATPHLPSAWHAPVRHWLVGIATPASPVPASSAGTAVHVLLFMRPQRLSSTSHAPERQTRKPTTGVHFPAPESAPAELAGTAEPLAIFAEHWPAVAFFSAHHSREPQDPSVQPGRHLPLPVSQKMPAWPAPVVHCRSLVHLPHLPELQNGLLDSHAYLLAALGLTVLSTSHVTHVLVALSQRLPVVQLVSGSVGAAAGHAPAVSVSSSISTGGRAAGPTWVKMAPSS